MFPLLDTLVAVYEIGQFTLAADELKVSQSTVSSRIAQLERMVGAPLFVRNAKSDVTPTEAGRLLYRAATGIDGTWRDACEQIARMRESREPLSVAFSHTTAAVLLPVALPVMAEAQQLVGDQPGRVLDAGLALVAGTDVPLADRELDDHADQQRDDQRAEQFESGVLLEP